MDGPKAALLAAYLVAMGWVSYRDIKIDHQPPQPRTIIKGSALYGLLGIAQPLLGDKLAASLGWGVLAATIMYDLSRGSGGPSDSGGLGQLLDPNGGKAPDASTPPPGTPPGTPPYLWGLPGVPDGGSRPTPGGSGGPGRVKFAFLPRGPVLGNRYLSV